MVSGTCTHRKRDKCAKTGHEQIGLSLDPPDHFRSHFASKLRSKNLTKNDHQKTLNLMPKRCQNRVEIDAKTHQKSMPELVMKKIMKIIKNHVSLSGKPLKFIVKTCVFDGLEGCARER